MSQKPFREPLVVLIDRVRSRILAHHAEAMHGLTDARFRVLYALAIQHQGMKQTDLIKIANMDRSTLSQVIRALAASRLVVSERDPENLRASIVRITPARRAAFQRVMSRLDRAENALLKDYPRLRFTLVDFAGF